MNVLVVGLNYAPEPVGIGPYTAGMAESLVAAGHTVCVVSGKAYYPRWELHPDHRRKGVLRSVENGVTVLRVPIYVPPRPTGAKRLIHHLSYMASALFPALRASRAVRPDVVICVAPSLISMVTARIVARRANARLWLHIQDFEVEAAFATGLLKDGGLLARLARAFEAWCLQATRISSISPQMCARLVAGGVAPERVVEFRNWAEIDAIRPMQTPSPYRAEFGITTEHVALYSGNIGNKQGIEILIDVARLLAHRTDLTIVIAGEGALRDQLVAAADGLGNVRFEPLQLRDRLSELLGLATVHLLPQLAGAADLVLPSKLTNMLASGRAVVATASAGTGLAHECDGCGLVTEPGDARAMAAAIEHLLDHPDERARYGAAARLRGEERWSRGAILARFETELRACAEAG
ncbi:WcaI family glycosyltransferase [Novosphingobium sp. Fuku2-ISO-50]|uniref:WcaI family glycosyltransferase n=1 Tax=Novosphingobium sp. Fuku2-ISO-50 TaxID=1739114 RepID=UPI00076D81B6|nr:WcaI family glycosyltransferase [Novosphingobium sp. Fuku2-ISO-50]KUR75536.1 colanic acid biosynthesis glycosyl transferase [Novosphingobium sp. Fuku2-ISO-50]